VIEYETGKSMNIEQFYRDGLLTIKILRRVTGLKRAGIHMRFKRKNEFRENEIDALRLYYYPLFRELFPEDLQPLTTQEEVK